MNTFRVLFTVSFHFLIETKIFMQIECRKFQCGIRMASKINLILFLSFKELTFKSNAQLYISTSIWVLHTPTYFDQHLGAGHSRRWLKYSFFLFYTQKAEKRKKNKKIVTKFSNLSHHHVFFPPFSSIYYFFLLTQIHQRRFSACYTD